MKTIKVIAVIIIGLLSLNLSAQQTKTERLVVPISNPGKVGSLEVSLVKGSLNVTGYDGKEVIIEASVEVKDRVSKVTSSGLTRLGGSSFEVEAEEKNNKVEISTSSWKSAINLTIKVPRNFSLQIGTVNGGDITVSNIEGEINATNVNGSIEIKEVSGLVSASTINGSIFVNFDKVTPGSPMAFSNMNGKIELWMPANTKANLKMKNERGETLTDFEVELDDKPHVERKSESKGVYKVSVSEWIIGKINGGGPEYLFTNFNGDIIIKKK